MDSTALSCLGIKGEKIAYWGKESRAMCAHEVVGEWSRCYRGEAESN